MVGGAASSVAGGAAITTGSQADGRELDSNEYFVDSLFRSDRMTPESNGGPVRAEVGRIVAKSLRQGDLPAADKSYLARLVASRTGLSQTDALQRVSDVVAGAQQAAETARKAIAHALLWVSLALLIGAFCASFAATIGGRQRDHVAIV